MTTPPVSTLIPHRSPFLFLDQVVELTEARVVARRTLRPDEPQFQGHYPDFALMPGVLLCEAALQAGAYLMAATAEEPRSDGFPVVTRMKDVRFKRPVRPGDEIEIEVEKTERVGPVQWLSGRVRVKGKLAAQLGFAVTLAGPGFGGSS
jgi:3-hydroxyacyl-[acyl-carrier-protein] dehydratase